MPAPLQYTRLDGAFEAKKGYFWNMNGTAPSFPAHLLPPDSRRVAPSSLHSYTLKRDIPLNYAVFNRNQEPVIAGVDAPSRGVIEALSHDYPQLAWIHDRTRRERPYYSCRTRSWTALQAEAAGTKRPRETHSAFLLILAGGLAILLWALLSR